MDKEKEVKARREQRTRDEQRKEKRGTTERQRTRNDEDQKEQSWSQNWFIFFAQIILIYLWGTPRGIVILVLRSTATFTVGLRRQNRQNEHFPCEKPLRKTVCLASCASFDDRLTRGNDPDT